METLTNVLVFLTIIGIAVLMHEVGHLVTAMMMGIHIKEFGVGLPPRIFTLGFWHGTKITLNLIPIGGFVRPEGEYDPERRGGFADSPPLTRFAVLLAGSISNLVMAFMLFTVAYMIGGPAEGKVSVMDVYENTPAATAGLLPDDLVVQVNGQSVKTATSLRTIISEHIGQELQLEVLRNDEMVQIRFKPRTTWPEGEGPAGFTTKVEIQHYNFFEAVARAANQVWVVLRDTVSTLVRTILGSGSKFRIVGPIGLKQASDWTIEQARNWRALYPVLYLAGLINVGLGFTNLLPIPALDGGRIVFVVYEVLTRRRFPYRIEKYIQAAGAIGIILGMILLSIMDIENPLF